jgi:ribosomal protein L13E
MKIERAVVKIKVDGVPLSRKGRGYSKTELREVGIQNTRIARSIGISVDKYRKTMHAENTKNLKKVLEGIPAKDKKVKKEKVTQATKNVGKSKKVKK